MPIEFRATRIADLLEVTLQNKSGFWVAPRSIIDDPNVDPIVSSAIVRFSIIYNNGIILSDHDYVHNGHFRREIQSKNGSEYLIKDGHVSIARRMIGSSSQSMEIIKSNLLYGSGLSESSKGIDEYDEVSELKYIDNNAVFLDWNGSAASDFYTSEITRVFRDVSFSESVLPRSVKNIISDYCLSKYLDGQSIRWSDFRKEGEMWRSVLYHNQSGVIDLDVLHSSIFNIARGPYVGFLPSHLGVGAIFSTEDALGIESWRGFSSISGQDRRLISTRRKRLSLSDQIVGLSRLNSDDISFILQSDEAVRFHRMKEENLRGFLEDRDVVDIVSDFKDTIDSYIQKRISASTSSVSDDYSFESLPDIAGRVGRAVLKFTVKQVVNSASGNALDWVEFVRDIGQTLFGASLLSPREQQLVDRGQSNERLRRRQADSIFSEIDETDGRLISGDLSFVGAICDTRLSLE